jgi:hypothetical protein
MGDSQLCSHVLALLPSFDHGVNPKTLGDLLHLGAAADDEGMIARGGCSNGSLGIPECKGSACLGIEHIAKPLLGVIEILDQDDDPGTRLAVSDATFHQRHWARIRGRI